MIIARYGQYAAMYMPSVGEVVELRLSPANPYARAVITRYSRRRNRVLKYWFIWMETVPGTTAVEGGESHVYIHPGRPPLIRQINRGQSPTPGPGKPDPS